MSKTTTTETSPSAQASSIWTKAIEDHFARVAGFVAGLEKLQTETLANGQKAADESARLAKATLDYAQELATSWRSMTLDATKKAMGAVTPATKG